MPTDDTMRGGSQVNASELFERFTLIAGEVNSGKTTFTGRLLDAYCQARKARVAVVDMAPNIPRTDVKGQAATSGVGGRLKVQISPYIRYFHQRIHAPRIMGRDEGEALGFAAENERLIARLFSDALRARPDAVFVNDCSLYLHAGDATRLLEWIKRPATAVVNGYYGGSLGDGLISRREREGMQYLMNRCDRLIML